VTIVGIPFTIGVDGQISLTTASEVPAGLPLVEECEAFLAAP